MNVKTWIPLILAIALGTVAMVVARKALRPGVGGDSAQSKTLPVVVAKRDVAVGSKLVAEDLVVVRKAAEAAPAKSYGNVQDLIGRVPVTPIAKGQDVLDTLLAPEGAGAGIQVLIEPGMRAITVETNEFTGLAGMLVPGSRVDVIVTMRDERSGQQVARTILQNVKVLAIGRQINPVAAENGQAAPPPSNNVTLLVNQKQAQALQLASQGGRPWLVLRNPRDGEEMETEGTTMAAVLGEPGGPGSGLWPTTAPATLPSTRPAFAQVQPAAPRVWVMRVIRGGVESRVSFPLPPEPTPHQDLQGQGAVAGLQPAPQEGASGAVQGEQIAQPPSEPAVPQDTGAATLDPFEGPPENRPADEAVTGAGQDVQELQK